MSKITDIIYEQFGGQRAMAMIDGISVADSETRLSIKFKGSCKANVFTVDYHEGADVYDVKFLRFNPRTCKLITVHEEKMVYAEQLASTFENFTGLLIGL